jgi:hypothetical protein
VTVVVVFTIVIPADDLELVIRDKDCLGDILVGMIVEDVLCNSRGDGCMPCRAEIIWHCYRNTICFEFTYLGDVNGGSDLSLDIKVNLMASLCVMATVIFSGLGAASFSAVPVLPVVTLS